MATIRRRSSQATVIHRVPVQGLCPDRLDAGKPPSPDGLSRRDARNRVTQIAGSTRRPSDRLRIIITTVADRLGLPYDGTGSYTFRRAGEGPIEGKGKEPDQSFYFANAGRLPTDRDPDLDAGDPPPDLWIEVDNRVSSAGRLPVYAALGVPEVWRYRSGRRRLQFLRLVEALRADRPEPLLARADAGPGPGSPGPGRRPLESEWVRLLRDWVARTIPRPAGGPDRSPSTPADEATSCPPSKATSPRPPAGSRSSRPGSTR